MLFLAGHLRKRLAEQMDTMDSDTRKRIEAVCVAMGLRTLTLRNWIEMLETIQQAAAQNEFVDWMEIERMDGKAVDIGLYRHYINPMVPLCRRHQTPRARHGRDIRDPRDGSESED
jgi:ATP-dependent DNA helicase DinG